MAKYFTWLAKLNRNGFGRAVTVVTAINIVLAVAAFFKDIILAAYIGTSAEGDAFLLAYFLPDTVASNLIASTLSVVCVPVFAKLHDSGNLKRLNNCIYGIITGFLAVSVILAVVSYIFRNQIVTFTGNGMDQQLKAVSLGIFEILLPIVVFYPAVAIGTAIMQVNGRFTVPAAAPVVFNLVFLLSLVSCMLLNVPVKNGVYVISSGITIGAGAMLLIIMISAFKSKSLSLPSYKTGDMLTGFKDTIYDVCDILRTFVPYFLILICSQFVLYMERYFASGIEVGSISGLNYAYRLAQFPVWVFVMALGTVILPSISKLKKGEGEDEFKDTLSKALIIVLTVTLPVSLILFFMRTPIITILFKRGTFDDTSLKITSGILAGYALSIVGQSIAFICLRAFLARGKMIYSIISFAVSSLVTVCLDIVLIDAAGSAALGYGAAIGASINAVLSLYFLKKELEIHPGKLLIKFFEIIIVNIPIAVLAVIINVLWNMVLMEGSMLMQGGFMLASALLFAIVYLFTLRLRRVI